MTCSRCFCHPLLPKCLHERESDTYVEIQNKKVVIKNLIIMMVNNVGSRAGLLIFVVPLESVYESIADQNSGAGTTGVSDLTICVFMKFNHLCDRWLQVSKLLRERLVQNPNGGDSRVVAVFLADDPQDVKCEINVALQQPGRILSCLT